MKDITKKIMSARNGSFQSVTWKSNPSPAAAHKAHKLEKLTTATVRAGIDFSNLGDVKNAIANGDRKEVGELPWGTWENFPHTIVHKDTRYVRLYPSGKPETTYFVDGQIVSKQEFEKFLRPSDCAKNEAVECFTIKEENLIG